RNFTVVSFSRSSSRQRRQPPDHGEMIDTQTDTATPSPASVSHCPVLPRSHDEPLTGLSARDGRFGGTPSARIRASRGVRRVACQAPSPCATLGATFNWLG